MLPQQLLSTAISGFQQGLILFPANSTGRLYIPSGLAFGTSPFKAIPPNSNLFYEVKLTAVSGTKLASDTAAIYSYLQNNLLYNTGKDPSGIRYTLNSSGVSGNKPVMADSILVTYTEQILNADTLVTSVNSPVKLALKDQVTAWRIMLPTYVEEGSQIVLYTPSGYAYGSSSVPGIPANSNLIYNIDLIKVIHH
jgi:FKBP-type peptidyl-prolyl cis-trans isomerase FkpA